MNPKRKEEYLTSLDLKEESKSPIRAMFKNAEFYEELFNMDLCEFRNDNLSLMFSEKRWANNMSTFNVYRNMIKNYTRWCAVCGYCADSNIIDGFSAKMISWSPIKNSMCADIESFIETMKDVYHIGDVIDERFIMHEALWCLAWLGFTKEESTNILKDQVGKDCIETEHWKVYNIHPFLKNVIDTACSVKEVDFFTATTSVRKRNFADSPYVLRPMQRNPELQAGAIRKELIDRWTGITKQHQKEVVNVLSPSYEKDISFSKFHTCGRYVALKEWESEHGEATLKNAELWCSLVRRNTPNTNKPKKSIALFLTSYAQWKDSLRVN